MTAYQRLKAMHGIGTFAEWVSRLLVPPRRGHWVEVGRGQGKGLVLLIYPRYESFFVRGEHEPQVQDLLVSWLRPGHVFLDVGAHMGFFSLLAGRIVGPNGTVAAIEPDPENFSRLVANISRNRLPWVRAVRAVVSETRGNVGFRRASDLSSRMEGRVETAPGDRVVLPVDALPLDELSDHGEGVVKVDVEGNELSVLRGAERTLAEGKFRWIVEVHTGDLGKSVKAAFHRFDYRCREIHTNHPLATDSRHHIAAEPAGSSMIDGERSA